MKQKTKIKTKWHGVVWSWRRFWRPVGLRVERVRGFFLRRRWQQVQGRRYMHLALAAGYMPEQYRLPSGLLGWVLMLGHGAWQVLVWVVVLVWESEGSRLRAEGRACWAAEHRLSRQAWGTRCGVVR